MSDRAVVRTGSSGDDVTHLQNALLKLSFSQVGEADGVFGAKTEEAVKAFQAINGLSTDGIVGPNTWAALDKAVGAGFGGDVL